MESPAAEHLEIDPAGSTALFSVKYIAGRVRGTFRRFGGAIWFDRGDLARTQALIIVDAASVDTGHARRDRDLRSAAFLAAERFPEIRFASTHAGRTSADAVELWGNLTMHGVTRSVPVRVSYTGPEAAAGGAGGETFRVEASVSRKQFEMGLNQVLEMGGLLVSDRIELTFHIRAVRRAAD